MSIKYELERPATIESCDITLSSKARIIDFESGLPEDKEDLHNFQK